MGSWTLDKDKQMTLPTREIVLAPGEGTHLTIGINQLTFKAVGADTHGHLGLFELMRRFDQEPVERDF